jgi:hypothetical protein
MDMIGGLVEMDRASPDWDSSTPHVYTSLNIILKAQREVSWLQSKRLEKFAVTVKVITFPEQRICVLLPM